MLNQRELSAEMTPLLKFAMRLCRNKADADDLLQATMLRALEKRHLFDTGSSIFKWGSKIMYNIFVSQYRRKSKFESSGDPEVIMKNLSTVESAVTKVELSEVAEAMENLSDEHRDVLLMVCVQGMSYQEVADAQKIPVGTVRSRLSRAREKLTGMMVLPRARHLLSPAPSWMRSANDMAHAA